MLAVVHLLFLFVLSGLLAGGAGHVNSTINVPKSEPEQVDAALHALEEDGHFASYLSLLRTHKNALKKFKSLSGLTLLVPTDDAFNEKSFQRYLKTLSQNQIVQLLKFHALPQYYSPSHLESVFNKKIVTVASRHHEKTFLLVIQSDYTINTTVNVARIKSEAFDAFPVVMYVINKVLIPADIVIPSPPPPVAPVYPVSVEALHALQLSPFFKKLSELLISTKLASQLETLPSFTLFAPTDWAFGSLPKDVWRDKLNNTQALKRVLKYHVVPAYYPPHFLGYLKAPVSTLASSPHSGDFQLKVTYLGGLKVMLETGVVKSFVVGIVFNKKPVIIYSVDHVLLPKEIF